MSSPRPFKVLGVQQIAVGGLDKQAVISFERVNLFDKELKVLVKLWIIGKDDKFVGDPDDGYMEHTSSSKFQSDDLYIDPSQDGFGSDYETIRKWEVGTVERNGSALRKAAAW